MTKRTHAEKDDMDILFLEDHRSRDLMRFRNLLQERHGGSPHLVGEACFQTDESWWLDALEEPAGFDLPLVSMLERARQLGLRALILIASEAELSDARSHFEGLEGVRLLDSSDFILDMPVFEGFRRAYDDAAHQRVLARARQSREKLARRIALRKAREAEEELNPFGS